MNSKHLPIPSESQKNIERHCYESGRMAYAREPDLNDASYSAARGNVK